MKCSVFVSYSHYDAYLVDPVVKLLRGMEEAVFIDSVSLKPGDRWREQLDSSLASARLVYVFWCHHSKASREVQREYQSAIAVRKLIIPVLFDSTPLPQSLADFQWVDCRSLAGKHHSEWWQNLKGIIELLAGLTGLLGLPLALARVIEVTRRSTPSSTFEVPESSWLPLAVGLIGGLGGMILASRALDRIRPRPQDGATDEIAAAVRADLRARAQGPEQAPDGTHNPSYLHERFQLEWQLPGEVDSMTHVILHDREASVENSLVVGGGRDRAETLLNLWTTLIERNESSAAIDYAALAYWKQTGRKLQRKSPPFPGDARRPDPDHA